MGFPRIVHRARSTYWEVSPGVFQATASESTRPSGVGGYANLAALCGLKGDTPPARLHYQRSFEEVRAERYIDRADYAARPPVICGSGDGHALATRDWREVTCTACLGKRPA